MVLKSEVFRFCNSPSSFSSILISHGSVPIFPYFYGLILNPHSFWFNAHAGSISIVVFKSNPFLVTKLEDPSGVGAAEDATMQATNGDSIMGNVPAGKVLENFRW